MRKIILCLVLVPSFATGQPAASSSSPSATIPKVRVISLRPSDAAYYPSDVAATGAQGTTLVRVSLDAAGAVTEAIIDQSSRSPKLDEAAVTLARSLSFKVREDSPSVPAVHVPVEFLRDSVSTLGGKSCGELNVDAQYHAATFPELPLKDMKVINMTIGILFMAQASASAEARISYSERLQDAVPRVFEECKPRPAANFLETFRRAIRDSGG